MFRRRNWTSFQMAFAVSGLSILGLVSIFDFAAYRVFQALGQRLLDHNLATVAQQVVTLLEEQGTLPDTVLLPPHYQIQVWARHSRQLLWAWPSELTRDPQPLDPLPWLADARLEGPTYRDVQRQGRMWRVLTWPVGPEDIGPGTPGLVIQVAAPLAVLEAILDYFLRWQIGLSSALVGLVMLGLYVMLKRVLAPLTYIAAMAREIVSADDLPRRMVPIRHNDEIASLVQSFNVTLARLERIFETQRRFLADVSHELRTPLTIIQTNAELMERLQAYDPEAVAAIKDTVNRLRRLVEDLLFLSRAESGRLPMRRTRVDLDDVVTDVLSQVSVLARKKNIRLVLEHLEPLIVTGDPDRLRQALLNLVNNALRYTPSGGEVRVGLRRSGDDALIWVADTGPGIPPEDLPYIFDRFYRADKARSRAEGDQQGFGLGLAIVRWIVRYHQGQVWVESELGRGTTFWIRLPLAEESLAALAEDEAGDDLDPGAEEAS
ncbi:MAG: HAMP domain-containing histidine kinase [Chloroflexi bacterium]|nr:HAMP domain-containing histidine kinase [Chloroflexota bacterium]